MSGDTKKGVKVLSWIVAIIIVSTSFAIWYFYVISKENIIIEEWYFVSGEFKVVYVDKIKDIVVFEIVIVGSNMKEDNYILFPKIKFDEKNWSIAHYRIYTENGLRPYEQLYNHTLIDIQPNEKLDTGDVLIIYNASKYGGKNITLYGEGSRYGAGWIYCKGVIPPLVQITPERMSYEKAVLEARGEAYG